MHARCFRTDFNIATRPFIVCTADRAHAYTLKVTSCEDGGTADTGVTFHFCAGGSYCDPSEDDEIALPANSGIEKGGQTIEIPVDLGFVPTTVDFEKMEGSSDSW